MIEEGEERQIQQHAKDASSPCTKRLLISTFVPTRNSRDGRVRPHSWYYPDSFTEC